MDKRTEELIDLLKAKLSEKDQDLNTYLEGFLYNRYINYWDYINVDQLTGIQKPVTNIPDEMVFIIYHQITELYFKLTLWEIKQISEAKNINAEFMLPKLKRIVAYFQNLTNSFGIMINGMEPEQFLKFRTSLTPASGFQSAQYRQIEIASTDLINLVYPTHREKLRNSTLPEMFNKIYWKWGATEIKTGKKAMTLTQFEEQYSEFLLSFAKAHQKNNLWQQYLKLPQDEQKDSSVINAMRSVDNYVNVKWPKVHIKSAQRYLEQANKDIEATGGTNWKKYLPAHIQRRIFYPELWSETEIENWGK